MRRRRPALTLAQRMEIVAFLLLVTLTLLFVLARPVTELDRVLARGELVVATRLGNTTYQPWANGTSGFEYDLASAFAEHLGVELRILVPDRFESILPMVNAGRADMAAAGITITRPRLSQVRFGPSYMQVTEQLIYRSGTDRPQSLADLEGRTILVVAGSSHVTTLAQLQQSYPWLEWEEVADTTPEDLLRQVWEGEAELTVVDSMELAATLRFFPELRVALELSEPRPLAWAFKRDADSTLLREAEVFFEQITEDGRLEQILERYFGHVEMLDYAGVLTFMRRIRNRLERFEPLFREAAEVHDMDWRLLAAISYQESHWDPRAVSYTGVRGLMMLTRATAGQLGIQDRTDPRDSVFGGAEYFTSLRGRLPDDIHEPDRTWMALAAYNVGLGHLHDARRITRSQGRDPNRWMDVMEHLPLLSQPDWYRQTRYGYARGWEPVQYVQNVRSFYDILTWLDTRDDAPGEPAPLPPRRGVAPLEILPPAL
ncbi:membrane-bound lytic murein transglycosylase MltF [Ectothiorhodospira variabilis]|uniref:membrane-bound lytic murein transglycosylase MltF n=1 Tax=Ectothiorhodospira variabilis TaxID=505694 RepID=UPI001EFB56A9|nr:membrane-bound lytic murein transglycosylase MltF [Ectothiorhodospira variabilis]MCG5497166.1 membrane-bound lytic murein transglycosylase MltF [Ectothiorhodospira variabilis]